MKSELAAHLRAEIIHGAYKPGEALRLEKIAADYDVSTMPVREALLTLETEGLVEIFPHRGAVVTQLSIEDLEDICDIRALLEEKSTRYAIPNLTDEDLDALASLVEQMDEHAGDASIELGLNHQFHVRLYQASGRKYLSEFNDLMRYRAQHYLYAYIDEVGSMAHAQVEHREILEACRQGDADKAATLVREHVIQAGKALVDHFRQRQEISS